MPWIVFLMWTKNRRFFVSITNFYLVVLMTHIYTRAITCYIMDYYCPLSLYLKWTRFLNVWCSIRIILEPLGMQFLCTALLSETFGRVSVFGKQWLSYSFWINAHVDLYFVYNICVVFKVTSFKINSFKLFYYMIFCLMLVL